MKLAHKENRTALYGNFRGLDLRQICAVKRAWRIRQKFRIRVRKCCDVSAAVNVSLSPQNK